MRLILQASYFFSAASKRKICAGKARKRAKREKRRKKKGGWSAAHAMKGKNEIIKCLVNSMSSQNPNQDALYFFFSSWQVVTLKDGKNVCSKR